MEDEIIEELMSVKGIGKSRAIALGEAGFRSIADLNEATLEELSAIKGITTSLAEGIKQEATQMMEGGEADEDVLEAELEEELEQEIEKEGAEDEEEPSEVVEEVPVSELEMSSEGLRLLNVRKRQKQKKPHFVQTDQHKKKKLKDTWRRPRGLHNKKRRYIMAKGQMARVGFGSPTTVKGLHPSGFREVLLDRVQGLEDIDPNTQAVRIARTLGQRKRMEIVKKAKSMGLKILNPPLEEEVQ